MNWQDLNLLKQNLNPAGFTLSQFAQAALFGQLGTVVPGQSLEYDGYGVTYASSVPFAASLGMVKLNENSQGTAIILGGASYSEGLGVVGNSSISLALNGQYSRFESTIGVDGSSNTGSSVIYDVYGDGQLLYQSPILTYASGAIPIDVNVAGVTTLRLVVLPAPGTIASTDHAVWADARLVSTANFGSTQPYSMTWQLAQNGTIVSTQTTDSFVFGAISGTYTLTLTVTDAQGGTATVSTSVVVTPGSASASYFMTDSQTEGNWIGTYGSQGYDMPQGWLSLPNYATVSISGAKGGRLGHQYARPPALRVDPGTYGSAYNWNSPTSFTVNVNFTDGQTHDLTLYALDWDNQKLSEMFQIINPATGAVLDTKTLAVSSFTQGVYLEWAVSGNIEIVVTNLSGPSAVLSGLFFDQPTTGTTYLSRLDGTTDGNWFGAYGTQGYDIAGDPASIPSYASITVSGGGIVGWPSLATAPQALENPNGVGRIADVWESSTSFTVNVTLNDGQAHELALYFVDWNNSGRVEQIQLVDPSSGAVLDTRVLSSFTSGVYYQYAVSGSVEIKITKVGRGSWPVLDGVFLDPAAGSVGNSTASLAASPTASLIGSNKATEGNWIGAYGTQGYDVIGTPASLPNYVTITPVGQLSSTWAATTTDPRALQTAGGTGRIAANWSSTTSFNVDVDLTDSFVHNLTLYFVDWDSTARTEQVQLFAASGGKLLDTETVSAFHSGVYLNWAVSGNVVIRITKLSGSSAVLSGLFLSAPTGSAYLLKVDTPTQGNWLGTYGTQGYDIAGDPASIPSYASITVSGGGRAGWPSLATTPQALENPNGVGQIADVWESSTSFTVNVTLNDGQAHELALYFVDWNNSGRVEQIQLINPSSGAVLSTTVLSSFTGGVYYQYAITGSVKIKITKVGTGSWPVLDGVFLDPAAGSASTSTASLAATPTASLISSDTTTDGNWLGTYGTQGYDIAGDPASIPSYASITVSGGGIVGWPSLATAPQALENPNGIGRIADVWESSTSFTVNVTLNDGQAHELALYFVDWKNSGRVEQIQLIDPSSGAVLDTRVLSSFTSGIYYQYAVSGSVEIKITKVGRGSWPVLDGVFLDPESQS